MRLADARRDSLQTLLVSTGCGGVLGLLPVFVVINPGKHSLKLGIPGLKDERPLAFKSVWIEVRSDEYQEV